MKRVGIGFIIGVCFSMGVGLPLVRSERRQSWDYGRKAGVVQGRFDATEAVGKEFGEWDRQAPYKVLLSVKTTELVSIETNGIKTVRVVP